MLLSPVLSIEAQIWGQVEGFAGEIWTDEASASHRQENMTQKKGNKVLDQGRL